MATTPLYRPQQGAMIFGVCAGIGRYFDVDPVLVRLVFVLLTLYGGLGIVAYVAFALVMPSERSVGQGTWGVVRENLQAVREGASVAGRGAAQALRAGTGDGGRRRYLFGLALVVLGTVALLAEMGLLWWIRWERVWPVVLIGLGLLLMVRRRA